MAAESIETDEVIKSLSGKILRYPTRYTIQLSETKHVEIKNGAEFLNHSCEPNACIMVDEKTDCITIRALKPILVESDICFNYNTTEWDMEESFLCQCEKCRTKSERTLVQGAKHLAWENVVDILPHATPIILRKLTQKWGAAVIAEKVRVPGTHH